MLSAIMHAVTASVACAAVEDLDAEGRADAAGPSGGASGSGGGAAAVANDGNSGGMRIYLSQIKEWMVEFACDMCFIVIRTDCAWYKIRTVHSAYAGWFEPILKVARIAVSLIGMVSEEARSSRLSFGDLAKRLAAQDKAAATFVSSKVPQARAPAPHMPRNSVLDVYRPDTARHCTPRRRFTVAADMRSSVCKTHAPLLLAWHRCWAPVILQVPLRCCELC